MKKTLPKKAATLANKVRKANAWGRGEELATALETHLPEVVAAGGFATGNAPLPFVEAYCARFRLQWSWVIDKALNVHL